MRASEAPAHSCSALAPVTSPPSPQVGAWGEGGEAEAEGREKVQHLGTVSLALGQGLSSSEPSLLNDDNDDVSRHVTCRPHPRSKATTQLARRRWAWGPCTALPSVAGDRLT